MIGPFEPGGVDAARASFAWPRWERFSIAEACLQRWARRAPSRAALIEVAAEGGARRWSYAEIDDAAGRCAGFFAARGLGFGDRVAVLLPQGAAALIAHFAAYKLGAIAVPLFAAFGPDAIQVRLEDAAVKAVVTDAEGAAKLAAIGADALEVITVNDVEAFLEALRRAEPLRPRAVSAEDPAFMAYTSGTTGQPKGALHAQRVVVGHLPAIQAWTMGLGAPSAATPVMWTPADWAWLGGLCNLLLPALFYGATVVAAPMRRFDPERAAALLGEQAVSHAFLPPTALRLMRANAARAPRGAVLTAIGSAGEAVGDAVAAWAEEALGAPVNAFYGQTECNGVVGWSQRFGARPAGALGAALPGFEIAVRTDDGAIVEAAAEGELLIKAPSPSLMLGYWRGGGVEAPPTPWWPTGDRIGIDETGMVRFAGRVDDVINSAGYRIGPAEIEDCLTAHPAVAAAGVVGARDALRGEAVVAFVERRADASEPTDALAEALIAYARARLGAYAAPRRVVFVDALPVTETGKIQRARLRDALAQAEEPKPG